MSETINEKTFHQADFQYDGMKFSALIEHCNLIARYIMEKEEQEIINHLLTFNRPALERVRNLINKALEKERQDEKV